MPAPHQRERRENSRGALAPAYGDDRNRTKIRGEPPGRRSKTRDLALEAEAAHHLQLATSAQSAAPQTIGALPTMSRGVLVTLVLVLGASPGEVSWQPLFQLI